MSGQVLFFFQAEDGIRDIGVTGVQTCALPIYSVKIVGSAYAMFIVGTLTNYFLIFPLTVRFLATYSVSPDVQNMLTIQSYIDTLLMMSLVFGIIFEIGRASCRERV